MKIKTKLLIFCFSASLFVTLIITTTRTYKGGNSNILFDHVRKSKFSRFDARFTQVKRITLKQKQPKNLILTIRMAAPLRLKPQDRLLIRVSVLTTKDYGRSMSNDGNQLEIVFPIGYTYASSPTVSSGYAGVIIYSGTRQKLLVRVPCFFDKEELTVTLNEDLLSDPNLAWSERFTNADVFYIPNSVGGQKAFRRGISMGSSNSHVDTVQLDTELSTGRIGPEHPKSSWENEKPTSLPNKVRDNS